MEDDLAKLVGGLRDQDFDVTVHAPLHGTGDTFLDVEKSAFKTEVLFFKGAGFGIFTSSDSFGTKPDEIHPGFETAIERISALYAETASLRANAAGR